MKRGTLFAAAAIVLAANGFGLLHAWRNRAGPVEAEITLTDRELTEGYARDEDDSGVALHLRWLAGPWFDPQKAHWLDENLLRQLGFDTSVAPSASTATEFYQRQRTRRAFVALEYDGPAWREHTAEGAQGSEPATDAYSVRVPAHVHDGETRLLAVDASLDAIQLRARHPDRHGTIIVPAVVRVAVVPAMRTNTSAPLTPARLSGWIQAIPDSIHVPQLFSEEFRNAGGERRTLHYRVHLRYGAALEPWIAGVEFLPGSE